MRERTRISVAGVALCLLVIASARAEDAVAASDGALARRAGALRAAVKDLIETFGDRYPGGAKFLTRLDTADLAKGSTGGK